MTKEQVISIRKTLQAGKNLPVRVYLDNAFSWIDEANILQFTLWDDDNELVYAFRLPPLEHGDYANSDNGGQNISLYVATYEQIQGMEVCPLPISYLPDVLDSINETRPISKDMREHILTVYNKILKENRVDPTHEFYNNLLGSHLDTNENYYEGKTSKNKGKVYPNEYDKYTK